MDRWTRARRAVTSPARDFGRQQGEVTSTVSPPQYEARQRLIGARGGTRASRPRVTGPVCLLGADSPDIGFWIFFMRQSTARHKALSSAISRPRYHQHPKKGRSRTSRARRSEGRAPGDIASPDRRVQKRAADSEGRPADVPQGRARRCWPGPSPARPTCPASRSAARLVEMFVGVGASSVRDLFEQGKKNEPCIVFIDESRGRTPRARSRRRSTTEREQKLNQLSARGRSIERGGSRWRPPIVLKCSTACCGPAASIGGLSSTVPTSRGAKAFSACTRRRSRCRTTWMWRCWRGAPRGFQGRTWPTW